MSATTVQLRRWKEPLNREIGSALPSGLVLKLSKYLGEGRLSDLLYWQIGRDILRLQKKHGWGAKVIDRLSADLRREFPEMRGLSPRNIKYMRAFAEAWPDEAIVQGPLAQITWYHNIALVEKMKGAEERLWYARQTIEQGWSRNVLVLQIESRRNRISPLMVIRCGLKPCGASGKTRCRRRKAKAEQPMTRGAISSTATLGGLGGEEF